MVKRKKRGKSVGQALKIVLLIVVAAAVWVVGYESFRTPILHATQTMVSRTQEGLHPSPRKKVRYIALEIPTPLEERAERIIHHQGYAVSYNTDWKLPNWVAYELTARETEGTERRSDRFQVDPELGNDCAMDRDFSGSGYDRGHMAPAADMKWSDTVMEESFYYSNMCPQSPALNRGRWKELEEQVREWALADSAIVVVCGPIVSNRKSRIGKGRVVVPQSFFKVILSPYVSSPRAIGFIMKNEKCSKKLYTYAVSVDSVESLTGIDFFPELPDELEDRVEVATDDGGWGMK